MKLMRWYWVWRAKSARRPADRRAAVAHLDWRDAALGSVAQFDVDPTVRRDAVAKLAPYKVSRGELLETAAKSDEDAEVRIAALAGVENLAVLAEIAKGDADAAVRKAATKQLEFERSRCTEIRKSDNQEYWASFVEVAKECFRRRYSGGQLELWYVSDGKLMKPSSGKTVGRFEVALQMARRAGAGLRQVMEVREIGDDVVRVDTRSYP